MKLLNYITAIIFMTNNCNYVEDYRYKYHTIINKEELQNFIEELEELSCSKLQPYLSSSIMKRAKYSFLPNTKLKYFNEGKNSLEDFIKIHPENIEAKYVRLMTQKEIPDFEFNND